MDMFGCVDKNSLGIPIVVKTLVALCLALPTGKTRVWAKELLRVCSKDTH
jgi:hypothetical protein